MKYLIFFLLSVSTATTSIGQTPEKVEILFSKNIELMGYIIHLGDPDDLDPQHPITQILNSQPTDRELPSLMKIFELAGDLDYSTITSIMYNLPQFPLPDRLPVSQILTDLFGYESEEKLQHLNLLIMEVNKFVKNSQFETIWSQLAPHRTKTIKTLEHNQPPASFYPVMEQYYQQQFKSYKLVPSLTIWSGPGWGFRTERGTVANFVMGPIDKNFDYSNKTKLQNLAIHEFGHCFVNHVLDANTTNLIQATEALYPPLQESMTRQGYSNWSACITEHFVRSGEVIVATLLEDHDSAASLMDDYTNNRSFVHLPFIVKRMKKYRLKKDYALSKAFQLTMRDLKKSSQNDKKI